MSDRPRFVIYARQSLSRFPDDSLSIEMQVKACREFAASRGGTVVGTFTDPDQKGWRRHRPGFDAMLDTIRNGSASCVILYKLSRFARDLMMQEAVVSEIAEAGGDLVSVTEPHVSTSPMVRQILGAVNENYRRDQSDWLRSTFAARARRGHHHGYAPWGYRIEAKCLVLDDETAPLVREVWDWALAGHGTPEITHRLTERGRVTAKGKPWTQTAVLRLLRNPVYAGHVPFGGEIVARDAHPAIVTDAEFAAVQSLIDRRASQRRKAAPSWAEGFVWHACGQRMYLATWTEGEVSRPRFRCYRANTGTRGDRCEVRPASLFGDLAEAVIVRELSALAGRLLEPDAVLAALAATAGASARERHKVRERIERRLADLDRQRDRLLDLFLAEKIDADRYAARDAALKAETATVRADLASVPPPLTAIEAADQHDRLADLTLAIPGLARHAPAGLVRVMVALDARLVVGGPCGPVLRVGDALAPWFG
jgi:DNA invertase Pin-like site-specific DNA recombinase